MAMRDLQIIAPTGNAGTGTGLGELSLIQEMEQANLQVGRKFFLTG